jgi:hypothetical protein
MPGGPLQPMRPKEARGGLACSRQGLGYVSTTASKRCQKWGNLMHATCGRSAIPSPTWVCETAVENAAVKGFRYSEAVRLVSPM